MSITSDVVCFDTILLNIFCSNLRIIDDGNTYAPIIIPTNNIIVNKSIYPPPRVNKKTKTYVTTFWLRFPPHFPNQE